MKNGIDNFIELLVKGDFFLIFLIVMMIVVTCIIAYLIKLQMNDRYSYEEDDEEDEDDNFESLRQFEYMEDEIFTPINFVDEVLFFVETLSVFL